MYLEIETPYLRQLYYNMHYLKVNYASALAVLSHTVFLRAARSGTPQAVVTQNILANWPFARGLDKLPKSWRYTVLF